MSPRVPTLMANVYFTEFVKSECDAMLSGISLPQFQSNLLPPSSGRAALIMSYIDLALPLLNCIYIAPC
jgi:hypothetical protein